jgi:hypothetical protein
MRIVPVVWSTALSTNVMWPCRALVVRRLGVDLEGALRHVLLQVGQPRLGNGERDVDGRDLVDDHERRRVVGADEVALVDHQGAGAPRDRRRDGRVLHLHLRVVDGRAVGLDRGFEGGRARPARLELLGRRDAAAGEVGVALRDDPGVGRLRDVALEIGLGLREGRLERPPVELEQDLVLLDVVAFLEVDRRELAGDLRPDGDDRVGFDSPDDADLDRHRLLHDRGHRDRHRLVAAAAPSAAAGARRAGLAASAG